MTHVERFDAVMNFEPVDRYPRIEWAGYWWMTTNRWCEEGMDASVEGAETIREHLGLDPYSQFWMAPGSAETPSPTHHGSGILKNEADYEAMHHTLYGGSDFGRDDFQRVRAENAAGERVVWISFNGFFWNPRQLFGIEGHLYAFYDHPELMHRMNRDLLAYNLKQLDGFCEQVCVPQFMTIAEDMSYNHGPMLSRQMFDEFLAPYYRPLVAEVKRRGIRVLVDSDGDVEPLIPWLKAVGVEGILPLERMAGVDVAKIRRDHPEWLMLGAYDKMVMKNGEAAMRAEFERLAPTMHGGGFIPSVDHQTPPDVSFENYQIYLKLLEQYTSSGA